MPDDDICDYCQKEGPTKTFHGWATSDDGIQLCEECYETACVEE